MSSDQFEDYATEPVPISVTVSGLRIGMVNGALAFAVPGIVTGLEIGGALGTRGSLGAFVLGGLVLATLGAITGIVGQINRLTTCLTISCVFGRGGAALINLLIALSLLGWYGVNMDLFSAVVGEFAQSWLGYEVNPNAIEIMGGVAMTLTTMFGFKLMARLSSLLVPVMVFVILYMAYRIFQLPDTTQGTDLEIALSFGDSVSIVIGSFIVGVVLMPDFTRFAPSRRDAAMASVIAFFVLSSLVYIVSAIAAARLASTDVIEVLMSLGMGTSALALILVSAWLTNVVNLYSAGLGINAVFSQLKDSHIVVVAGLLGTAAAMLNILDRFTDFLFGLAILFAPVAGVYVADFFVIRRSQQYDLAEISTNPGVRWSALFSWLTGIAVSYASQSGYISLLNLEALEATAAAMLCYLLINRIGATR